jgi:hypothetical protein
VADLLHEAAARRVNELVDQINAHRRAYYEGNTVLISDAEYDALAYSIDLSIDTNNPVMDAWFRREFTPDTGQWVHHHPNKAGLAYYANLWRNRNERLRMTDNLKRVATDIGLALDAHTAALYDDGHRKHLGASQIGDPCARKLWYGFRWCLTPNYVNAKGDDHKGRMMRLFNRGHKEEARLVEWLRGIGCEVEDTDADGKQFRITGCDGHFGGSCDGKIKLPAVFGSSPKMLLEFKTSGEKAFVKLKDNGVRAEKPVHFVQMCVYGEKLGLEHALYMAVNKNTDEIYIEVVALNRAVAEQAQQKAQAIIDAHVPPPKLNENAAYYLCKFCDFWPVCHGTAPYEKNCRSCKFAKASHSKQWFCQMHNAFIPDDYIAQGCDGYQEAR